MELAEQIWKPVNEQAHNNGIFGKVLTWCSSCERQTDPIPLKEVNYKYKVNIFEYENDYLVKRLKTVEIELLADEHVFSFNFPHKEGWEEVSDDFHHLTFRKWLNKSKTVYQDIYIPCYPKLYLSDYKDSVTEFLKQKPTITNRVYEIVEIVELDRVTGTMEIRVDEYKVEK